MKASKECIEAIKRFEGLHLEVYRCPAGVLTIGYGHTSNIPSKSISEWQAKKLLEHDVAICENQVNNLRLKLNQGQFDALVDFVFNLGIARLKSSTLLKYVKSCPESDLVGKEFERWVYANGRILQGLKKRRQWEKERYYSQFCRLF